MKFARPDPDLRGVHWAADLVGKLQKADEGLEHLAEQVRQLQDKLVAAQRDNQRHFAEALFWESRAHALARALGRWQAYDRAQKAPSAAPSAAQSRLYCDALAATREALKGFQFTGLH
jgi:hypothetical protein